MRNLPFIFAIIGFTCLCLSTNYSQEAVIAKAAILVISSFCLLYGMNRSFIPAQQTKTVDAKIQNYITMLSSTIKDLDKRPEVKATFFQQMAHTEFASGNYKTAITCYLKAMKYGADEDAMDENIWESFRSFYKKTKDEDYVKNYFEWVPFGAFHSEAKALLIGHYS